MGFLVAMGWLVSAQFTPGSRIPIPTQPGLGEGPNLDPLSEAKRMKALNADRHKTMVSDTEKLVKLARQLDAEIASNPTDALTPEEAQKVAAIEKLAHNVKTKMAQSFGAGPEFRPPLIDSRGPGAQ
jgi:hypothetical protein